jgi:hypothetical protein
VIIQEHLSDLPTPPDTTRAGTDMRMPMPKRP